MYVKKACCGYEIIRNASKILMLGNISGTKPFCLSAVYAEANSLDAFLFSAGIHSCCFHHFRVMMSHNLRFLSWTFYCRFCPGWNFTTAMSSVWCLFNLKAPQSQLLLCFFFSSFFFPPEDSFLIAEALVISWMGFWCILQSSNLSSNHKVAGSCHWLLW